MGLSPSDIGKLRRRLVAIYPISGLKFIPARRLNFGTMPKDGPGNDLLADLQMKRVLDGCLSEWGCNRIYYGALPQESQDWGGLASHIPSQESCDHASSNIPHRDIIAMLTR